MNIEIQQRVKELFENTVESDASKYDGTISNIDYFGLFCKATTEERVNKVLGVDSCMFNYVHDGNDSVLMVFYIPINSESSNKHIADKVMKIVKLMEKCFVTIDYISSKEIKDEKFVYVTIIKKVNNNKELEN